LKRIIPLFVATLTSFFVLAGLIWPVSLGGYLNIVLDWAIIVGAMALLVAIAHLFLAQWRKIARGNRSSFYSLVFVIVFLLSLGGGLVMGVDDPEYRLWISSIQKPLEVSLLGLAAVVMAGAGVQFYRTRGWSPLTVAFGVSALVFLVIDLGFLQVLNSPPVNAIIKTLQMLPLIGARGLLIGMSFGALIVALKALTGEGVGND